MNQTAPVKRIAIFGSTGSIGTQALEVIAANPDRFSTEVLTCGSNDELLIQQAIKYNPNIVVIGDEKKYSKVKDALANTDIKVFAGEKGLEEVASMDVYDLMLAAIVGYAGLKPTLNAINSGKAVALANKETLVVAGDIIMQSAINNRVPVIPVDSEHSAIFQCLVGEMRNPIEKVIGEEVEQSLLKASQDENVRITEFTVAPMIGQDKGKSYHEWFVEFENEPANLDAFALKLNNYLREKNIYYDDLITGNILQPLKLTIVKKNGFIDYMKSVGKLGGQNKVPRLSNDRKIADDLSRWAAKTPIVKSESNL